MKKLEDLPKSDIFEVPKGYFDALPGIVQARTARSTQATGWGRLSLRFALPAVIVVFVFWFFVLDPSAPPSDDLLSGIDTESLVAYLDDSDVSAEELLDSVPLDLEEANAVEDGLIRSLEFGDDDAEYLTREFSKDLF